MRPLRLGTKSPTSGPYPWPSWAPAVATAVPHRLRHIVEVMRHIEVDWLMSARMPCDLVLDVDDPAVELALMILEGGWQYRSRSRREREPGCPLRRRRSGQHV